LFLAAATFGGCGAALAQAPAPGPFSKDQVDRGHDQFRENCSECHGINLAGVTAPALGGKPFLDHWGKQSSAELYTFIRKTMPMCQAGVLANDAYADIVAFLLWANGAEPGKDSFDGSASANVGSVVTGTVRPEVAQAK